jgi:DNA-directed RNA polymerase specialized sigma24 family protein
MVVIARSQTVTQDRCPVANEPPTPQTPEEMAVAAADCATPAQTRNDLIVALRPLIEQAALVAARAIHADAQLRQDLLDQSLDHVVERLSKFDPTRGNFQGWTRMVLQNLGCNLRRSRGSRREFTQVKETIEALPDANASGAAEAFERLGSYFGDLRAVLDDHAWQPSRHVDYYAVLLLMLRLELADLYRSTFGERPPGEVAERVVAWLPWHTHETGRCCRPGLPTLAAMWSVLAPQLGERLEGLHAVVEIVNCMNGMAGGTRLTYATLAQWTFRARKEAQERFGEDWHAAGFARLLCRGGDNS